jgi:hypothetical protein
MLWCLAHEVAPRYVTLLIPNCTLWCLFGRLRLHWVHFVLRVFILLRVRNLWMGACEIDSLCNDLEVNLG